MSAANEPDRAGEERLRQSEERYRLLVENVKDYAIFMLDPSGYILTWNEGAERIKGYTAAEIVGQHFSRFYPPDAVASGWPAHELREAARLGRFEHEGWRLRKDGTRFWANVVITALYDAGGTLRGFAKVTRDLTERRRAEEQARALACTEAARVAAEDASRRKDEFLAMLAHELRNPLAPILNGLAILAQVGQDEPTHARTLAMIDRQTRHLKRMVDDLLDVARLAHGKVELRPRRLDLARLVGNLTVDRRGAFERAGMVLDAAVPPGPVWVNGDEARLAQLLGNLLDNATKFSRPADRTEVRLETDAAAAQAVLSVRDHGAGIAAELVGRLFEPFAQAPGSAGRLREGLGLGLAVVRGLAELHGGQVEAASAGPGQGTTFTVRLPLLGEPAALAAPLPPATTVQGPHARVLVVEDHPDAAESLRLLLELLGHEVRVAHSGPEGVQTALTWQPDVVLSDIGLPGYDGYEVARRVRREPALAGTLLVALTGYGGTEDRRKSLEAGFRHHLVKPADPDDISRVLSATAI